MVVYVRQILRDGLNHIFREYSVKSGFLYPSAIFNQTLDSHKKVDIFCHPVDSH
jgi:hypothetical protein